MKILINLFFFGLMFCCTACKSDKSDADAGVQPPVTVDGGSAD